VLLTTHYMEEAARLCDRLAILDHGKVIALGTPAELIAKLGAPHVVEVLAQPALSADGIASIPGVNKTSEKADVLMLHVVDIGAALPALLALAQKEGAALKHLVTREATLEDVFVHLTGTGLRDG
jgi:ABC-2 type transport system ATP-binding protein